MNITARDKSGVNSDDMTINELLEKGVISEELHGLIQMEKMWADAQEAQLKAVLPTFVKDLRQEFKKDMLNMLLPDGTRFGDTMLIDLLNLNYADKTMDEIAELLVDPDEDEAEFLEDGDTPTPEPEFISEEEDENPSGVVPRRKN